MPFLFLLTDAARLQTPQKLLQAAPQGSAIIIRTFGDDDVLIKANKNRGVKISATVSPRTANKIDLAGIHIPNQFLKYYRKSQARPKTITASAHNLREILRVKRLGITNILLSPVFPSDSNSANKRPIGAIRLAKIARDFGALQFIALGGINRITLKRLSGTNVKAVAGVSFRKMPRQKSPKI